LQYEALAEFLRKISIKKIKIKKTAPSIISCDQAKERQGKPEEN
jgi:hypothetical protein